MDRIEFANRVCGSCGVQRHGNWIRDRTAFGFRLLLVGLLTGRHVKHGDLCHTVWRRWGEGRVEVKQEVEGEKHTRF